MRTPLIATLLAVVCAPFASALERDEARHLLARTGFSPTPGEIEQLLPLTREQAVDGILASTRTTPRTAIPAWAAGTLPQWNAKRREEEEQIKRLSTEKERMDKGNEFRAIRYKQGDELKAWWYGEMIATDSPLTERMTLFWSNHFTSSLRGVEDPRLIYEQHANLRKGALDNFAFLLKDINTDPAMFYYLDSNSNTAGRPNENYAREVMELFTLGEGVKYTEADIKEVARAFTGYKIDEKTGRAALTEGAHDGGWKTILGRKAAFNGDEVVIELLRSEEQVALYVAEKIWKEFVNDAADHKEIRRLAGIFYRGKYDIKKLLRATFLSDRFWDKANRGTLFKSPVELLVGAARVLQLPADNTDGYVNLGKKLGQDIFDPPNVKGWKGSTAWISSESLLSRWEVVEDFLRGKIGEGKSYGGAMMGGPAMAAPEPKAEAKKEEPAKGGKAEAPKKKDAEAKPVEAPLPLLAKPWIAEAKTKGAEGVELAIAVLLPLAPLDDIARTNFDQAMRQILHDPTFNLK